MICVYVPSYIFDHNIRKRYLGILNSWPFKEYLLLKNPVSQDYMKSIFLKT